MIPSTILAYPARVLKQAQREHYFNFGYTSVEMVIPPSKSWCRMMLMARILVVLFWVLGLSLPFGAAADFIGHGGMVRSVALSADGRRVLTGSFDFSSALWNFEDQREIVVFDGHAGPVTHVTFIAGDRRMASAGDDGSVMLWDLLDSKPRLTRELRGHRHKVMALAVTDDGNLLASGSWDKTVRIWRLVDYGLERRLDLPVPVNALAFINDDGLIAVGGHDPVIRLYDSVSGQARGKLEGHKMGITALDVSTDGTLLASASIDKTVKLWDLTNFTKVAEFEHFESQVYAVSFLPDGESLVSAGRDGIIVHWDIASGEALRRIKAHDAIVWSLAVTPNGRFVVSASSDDSARVWHLETGDRIGVVAEDILKNEPQVWLTSEHPGASLFGKCARCHALSSNGTRRSGPHLKGLFGRRVGSVSGYNYSAALRAKTFEWDEETLFYLFDQGPDKFLPGTKMPVQRMPDSEALAQLIDYLKKATGPTLGVK